MGNRCMKVPIFILLLAATLPAQMRLAQQSPNFQPNPPGGAEPAANLPSPAEGAPEITLVVNKSVILDHASGVRRLSITNSEIAEAVAVSSVELLINGKSAGDTSLILWDRAGRRLKYDVHVVANDSKLDVIRAELVNEVGPNASLTLEDGNVFLRGTVADSILADRAAAIAGTLGKIVNLLRVSIPAEQPQILLKVRFASVSRTASLQLGFNFFSGNAKGVGSTTTAQYGQPPDGLLGGAAGSGLSLTDLLNIFYFRPDLNIGAVIQALEAKSQAEILAEPNLLTVSGRPASFLAGGEFPFPTIQGGGSGVGQITIEFKEFGIKLNFLPTITPTGAIHLVVTPEVSSLDYANGLTVGGFTVPGLSTRRVTTEIELQNGQSFVIAGLLNNQVTQQLDKIPGLANIPVLGKLFQSKSITKNDDELLVLVTPELVRPIPEGVKAPDLKMPLPFMKEGLKEAPRTSGAAVTGAPAPLPKFDSLPAEELKNLAPAASAPPPSNGQPPLLVVQPVQLTPAAAPGSPQTPPSSNH